MSDSAQTFDDNGLPNANSNSNSPVPFENQAKPPADINLLAQALEGATSPEDVRKVEGGIDLYEGWLKAAGLWALDKIRPVNEMRLRARWKLGQLLKLEERSQGSRTDLTSGADRPKLFTERLKEIDLKTTAAKEAIRLSALPEPEFEKALADAQKEDSLLSFKGAVKLARTYWYQESRQRKHEDIAASAVKRAKVVGPFPLIYADPPWKFETYSDKGLERAPDQHYPTLTDDEIIEFTIDGVSVEDIAHRDAALFLWCTSSNLERALGIMRAWGFKFKTSAVWVKDHAATALVFRNQHELILYGTKGNMPGPQYQPLSVFTYPRREHSAKPPEVRLEIEKMYPDFDKRTRLELFARGDIEGWTTYGNQATDTAAA